MLDAWPIIEHYEGNGPASTEVETLLARRRPRPIMSAATFTEIYYTLANRHDADSAERAQPPRLPDVVTRTSSPRHSVRPLRQTDDGGE